MSTSRPSRFARFKQQWSSFFPSCVRPRELTDLSSVPPLDFSVPSQAQQVSGKAEQDSENDIYTPVPPKEYKIKKADIRFLQKIGAGGFGTVYRAIWNEQIVAVKVVETKKQDQLNDMQKEKNILQELTERDAPNTVKFLAFANEDPEYCIVMEHASHSLDYYIDLQRDDHIPFLWKNRYKVIRGVTAGLEFLHIVMEWVHGDIKSPNILIRHDMEPLICDFETAIKSGSKSHKNGLIDGSMRWMPPEILRGTEKTTASDIFSLAYLYWEVLTCAIPFSYIDNDEELGRALITRPSKREKIPLSCPPKLSQMITSCWAVPPSQRPSATKLMGQMKGLEADLKSMKLI